jgi:alpha-L-fucosidase 2
MTVKTGNVQGGSGETVFGQASALVLFLFSFVLFPFCHPAARASGTDTFSVKHQTLTWLSPGENALGSMPLGNGDIGLNVWVERSGDILFYIAKSDAWCENGRLLKLGRIRITLSPNPFADSSSFRQELSLREGYITLSTGRAGTASRLRLWVDANNPAIITEIESAVPTSIRVNLELWRTHRREMTSTDETESAYGLHGPGATPVVVEADSILPHGANRLAWYHRNHRSVWKSNLSLQDLEEGMRTQVDPLLGRTFGGVIEGKGFRAIADTILQSVHPERRSDLLIHLRTTTDVSPEKWLYETDREIKRILSLKLSETFDTHRKWWENFWKRSSIVVSSLDPSAHRVAETVTRGYMLQRYMNACGGRGTFPIKFNGSLFTVDTYDRPDTTKRFDADYRLWGGPYWFQNTRLTYWPMLSAGDTDLMTPFFRMYTGVLPLRRHATQCYYGHAGAFFPEVMNFWGTYTDGNYGRDRTGKPSGLTDNRYIRYYWTGGLELSLMMLDFAEFTGSQTFVRDTLVPLASEVLAFFDQHWPRDSNGTIRFEPAQALETYQRAVNPMPDVAGIRVVAERMLALPHTFTSPAQRDQWARLMAALPPLPTRVVDGDTLLAPAAEYGESANIENPELYAVFPFRFFGIGKPDLDKARRTYKHRPYTMNGGWQQHAIQAAYLGLAQEAGRLVAQNFGISDTLCRFPAFWGPNYDWTPDQDHGSVAAIALQRMLIQYEGKTILLLPAWPPEWDVTFRLHVPYRTTIECTVRGRKVVKLLVTPESRRRDILSPDYVVAH